MSGVVSVRAQFSVANQSTSSHTGAFNTTTRGPLWCARGNVVVGVGADEAWTCAAGVKDGGVLELESQKDLQREVRDDLQGVCLGDDNCGVVRRGQGVLGALSEFLSREEECRGGPFDQRAEEGELVAVLREENRLLRAPRL